MDKLKSGLCVLSKPIEVGLLGWEGGGEVEVLVLEYEESGGVGRGRSGVEDDIVSGFTGDGKAKGSGVDESENEVRMGVGEDRGVGVLVLWGSIRKPMKGGKWWRRWWRWWPREDIVGDFPSLVVCVSNADPQGIVVL